MALRGVEKIRIDDRSNLVITWEKDHEQRCSGKWLLLNCSCEKCKSSIVRGYKRTNMSDNVVTKNAVIRGDELSCVICGLDDNLYHEAIVPTDVILNNCKCHSCIETELKARKTRARSPSNAPPLLEYSDDFTDEKLFSVLRDIIDHGFCVVQNFPTVDSKSMVDFAQTFGFIRSTLYDTFFRIRSEKRPNTVALTALEIALHQDIIIYESSPGTLLLLTLRFDETVEGGRSKVVDSLGCAEILRQQHPDHFETLCRVPATFQTIRMNQFQSAWIKSTKPHIELDCFGEITAVHWSSSIEGTLRIREEDVDAYYRARKAFKKILQDPANQFLFRSQPGDLMIVNNHRMLHSREAFTSHEEGDRDLLGFFIEMDDIKSKYVTLAEKLRKTIIPPKIGGRSSF